MARYPNRKGSQARTVMDPLGLNSRFCRLCDTFLAGEAKDNTTKLDAIAKDLALDENLRVQMGTSDPSIWPGLRRVWDELSRRVALDEGDAPTRCLVTSFARFTRNLVAAVPDNQRNAFVNEPYLLRILHAYSSWTVTQDLHSYAVTRMLVQTLSNIVTANDDLMTPFWAIQMHLPEERSVFIRLLGSPDAPTITSLLVLLVNCIHKSDYRRRLLAETHVGARLCITLLDRTATLYDAEESSESGKAFGYMYHLFTHLFDGGFAAKLYTSLKIPGEIIAPHQTTLFKLLDSYLHSTHASVALLEICPMLTECFSELCIFSIQAVRNSIVPDDAAGADGGSSGRGAFDLLLPKACEALVLVTQCLVSAMLEFEENCIEKHSKDELCFLIRGAVSPHGQGIATSAIEMLRILDAFLPRIQFGKPVLSSEATRNIPETTDPTGFSYVKRDLVRLLGVLCYRDRKTQDSIRSCGGINVVLNMCVMDERNPYLREHAIFTLHNLLEDNEENQNVVNSIQPSERWDQDGRLQR